MRAHLTLAVLAITFAASASASTSPTTDTPASNPNEVTLALGGGGARGFAHIGVLKYLDDHHVPIAAIAGTSIGGLVGGAFASGLSAAEIESLIVATDFDELLTWDVPHAALTYRDKRNALELPGAVQTGLLGGRPLGVSAGHAIGLMISRITFPVSDVDDFDALPTPFRAVAVDIVRAEQVVLDDGPLSGAMLATMSLPGFFHPRPLDGGLLIDGGPLNTVPADVARNMHEGRVIAVDVSPALKPSEDIGGFVDVFFQSLSAPVRANIDRSLTGDEIYVRPDVDDVKPSDYHRAAELIARGYAAMDSLDVDLTPYQLTPEAYAEWKARRHERRNLREPFVPTFVEVDATDAANRADVERALQPLLDEPLDLDTLEFALTRLKATGRFYSLKYALARRDDEVGLRILTYERHRTRELLAALEARPTETDDFELGLRARLLVDGLAGRDSQWQTDLRVGPCLTLRSELYVPLRGPLFVSTHGEASQRTRALHDDGRRLGEYRERRAAAGLDVGLGHGWLHHELRAGIVVRHVARDDETGLPDLAASSAATARLRLGFDTTDATTIPHRGLRGAANARHGFHRTATDDAIDQLDANVAAWIPFGRHSLVARVEGGTTFDRNAPLEDLYGLGGPFRLGAWRPQSRLGSNFEYAALGWQHRLDESNPYARGALLFLVETGATHAHDVDPSFTTSGSVNLLLDTPLGDLMTGIAASGEDVRGYVVVGVVPY